MVENKTPTLEVSTSGQFASWLAGTANSLAFSTYQAGKVFLIGTRPDGQLSIYERSFARCMGLGTHETGFWMSSLQQLWRFENFLEPGQLSHHHDAVYVPITGHTTGDVDIHDVHDAGQGPVFVATRFNCLATISSRGSFELIWKPPFIDALVAEDRCHLNGLAMREGVPAFVTCVAPTRTENAWRDHRRDGGIVLDVESGATVAEGLSMPHSPRWHKDQLWVIQSGTGEFGRIDMGTGAFEPLCQLQGFARGLAFFGEHAVIGVSRPRKNNTFEGLEINDRLERDGLTPACYLAVIRLRTGAMEHWIRFEGAIQELYDVVRLPAACPSVIGFRSDEIRYMIKPITR